MPMEVHTNQLQTQTTTQTVKTVPADSYSLLWKKATQDKKRTPLNELITFDWSKDDQSVGKFIEFIINLVTFNQSYAIDAFTLLSTSFEPYKQALATGTTVNYDKWEKISMRIHFSLNKIVSVLPLSAPVLADILIQKFPHTTHTIEVHHFFLKHVLFVTRYCPSISAKLIASVLNTLVLIDTSISIEEVPDDEELQFDDFEDNGSSSTKKTNPEDQEKNALNAQKLDALMVLMFQYLDACFGVDQLGSGNMFVFEGSREADLANQDDLFHHLVKAFDSCVLPTYKCKYTQFLLIYACRIYQRKSTFAPLNYNTSLLQTLTLLSPFKQPSSPTSHSPKRYSSSPSKRSKFLHIDPIATPPSQILYAESYIRYLFGKLSNERIPSILRHACAAYIGGFISRANFLPPYLIKLAFKELVLFAVTYVERYDTKMNECNPNPQLHSLFYSVCQSLYYIFCFRNSVILDFSADYPNDQHGEKQREFWQDLHEAFRKISYSRLNPFKICLKTVVKQFCAVCLRVGIFTKCTSILQANKNIVKSKTVGFNSDYQQQNGNQFDSFFPFDPYLLAQSAKYVDRCYLHWTDVKKDDDDIDLEEISDDEEEEEDDNNKNKMSSDSDSEFDDFDEDEDDDSDDDDEEEDEDDSEVDQLTEDFMSFTPTGMPDAAYQHFKSRGFK